MGNDFIADKVVYSGNSGGQPWDVTSKPEGASWIGACHLSGNVWEWSSSLYESYPYVETDGREDLTVDGRRVLRGGSWFNLQDFLRAAFRNRNSPRGRNVDLGFWLVLHLSSLNH